MSLSTPKISDVNDNIIAQLESSFNQTIPLLPLAFNRVIAKVTAGIFILLYKYGGFMFLQLFIETASINETIVNGVKIRPLVLWGNQIGADPPGVSVQAEYTIDITVTNQVGSLDSGTQLLNSNNGVTYVTLGSVLLNASTVSVNIRAVADQSGGNGSGTIGNLNVSDIVSFANSLSNVARDTIVTAEVLTGANGESEENYRTRVLNLFKKRPQGGALADYEQWGLEVTGMVNIYPYTGNTPGQVDVFAQATVASSGNPDGIPTVAQLQTVLDNINLDQSGFATRRPTGALVNTIAITRKAFDVQVVGITDVDNLASIQTAINSAVVEYFLNVDPFIDGLTVPPRNDRLTRSAIIGLVEDLVTAANGTFITILLNETLVPALTIESYVLQQGEKAKLDTSVSFV